MRIRRCVPVLAAALTLATASPAYALVPVGAGGGPRTATARHHSSDPSDATIAVIAAGGVTLAGAGLATRRSRQRRTRRSVTAA